MTDQEKSLPDWVEGTILENRHWTGNLFSLRVQAEVDEFIAGQYTSLALDLNGEYKAQPYSYLSAPGEQPLEFYLYTNLDGELSTSLAQLKDGDHLWVQREAGGLFTLAEVPRGDDLWLLATSTGVAPFLSMLRTVEPWQRFKRVVLVYAARTSGDLNYLSLIEEIGRNYGEAFSFVPVISRETVRGTLAGRIPAHISDGSLEQAAGRELSPESSQVMLCGNPGMVDDANLALQKRGFMKNRRGAPGQITFESYW